MAYPYPSNAIPRQSDEEFASWLAGQGHSVMDFLNESGARANPAAHPPPDNMVKVGTAVRSPADATAAMPKPVDPLTARLERDAAMNDNGLAANQRSAAQLDEVDRAYQRGAGNLSEATPDELRHSMGFSWGAGVDVDPATGRPRSNSSISTYDPSQGRTTIAANESQGGGGVSTLGEGPRFRNIQPWQVEDAGRAADVAAAERAVEDPLWHQRAVAGLDVERQTGIARGKADVETEQQQRIMQDLEGYDQQVDAEIIDNLVRLRQRPDFARLPPEERLRKEAVVRQAGETAKAGQRQRLGLATGRITTTFKGAAGDQFGG